MPNEVLKKVGTPQISFADHAGDFLPTVTNSLEVGTPTDVQLSLASVANAAARQSVKVDLGLRRPAMYEVMVAVELAATPTAGASFDLFWAPSSSATPANGNPGGVSGSDAAYTGLNANLGDSLKMLDYIGSMICTADITPIVQVAFAGVWAPSNRYGSLVVVNYSIASIHTDDVECHIVFNPIIDEVQ